MQTVLERAKIKWLQIALFAVFFASLPILLEHYYLESTTTDYWFRYDSIVVTDEVSFTDSSIDVVSFAEIKRPVQISWIDTLYCNSGNGFEFVLSNESGNFYEGPVKLPRIDINPDTRVQTFIPWRFNTDERLESGEVCHITSTITAILGAHITPKTQTITSNDFIIK